MGTSTSNYGQNGRTPLVPSWLDDEDQTDHVEPLGTNTERFREPRGTFTRYVNSAGRSSKHLHKSLSKYIKHSLGGAKNATTRLGSSRTSTARLLSFWGSVSQNGVDETSRAYRLGNLIGQNASDVLLRIMDFVCPDGGATDEGIARGSYIETIASLPELNDILIENMTEQQFLVFIETYMANVIQQRLLNDIGNKTISLPDDIYTVSVIQNQVNSYIFGAVSDAIAQLNVEISNIESTQTRSIVDSIYEQSYSILESLGEE